MGRCPTDDFALTQPYVNYMGSMGPTCWFSQCGANMFIHNCRRPDLGYGMRHIDLDHRACMTGSGEPPQCYGPLGGMFTRFGFTHSRIKDVTDGTSKTILLGEQLPATELHMKCITNEFGFWASNNSGTATGNVIVPINWPIDPDLIPVFILPSGRARCFNARCGSQSTRQFSPRNYNTSGGFKSKHPGGAIFTLVDGSAHFLSENIDMDTYLVMGHRSDGHMFNELPY
jgi:hypothetical protein